MKSSISLKLGAIVLCAFAFGPSAQAQKMANDDKRPPRVTVQHTDFGMVFADEKGMTLYRSAASINGGREGCPHYVTGGPDADNVPTKNGPGPAINKKFVGTATCADKYFLFTADGDAKPVGKWTIVTRKDGSRQWAFDGQPLFRSVKDLVPGDVNEDGPQHMAIATPAYVPVPTPPGIEVVRNSLGQYLTATTMSAAGLTLYTYDQDRRGKSACEKTCTDTWKPLLTGALFKSDMPDWSVVTREDGSRQWAYKGKAVYTNVNDTVTGHRNGESVPSWRIAFIGSTVSPPADIEVRNTWLGEVYAQRKDGRSVYAYSCVFTVGCDDPSDEADYSRYWHAYCGSSEECAKMFQPVLALENAKNRGRTWTVVKIKAPWSPVRLADGAKDESISVWAYKGRPLFTFSGDTKPGHLNGYGVYRLGGGLKWTPFGPIGNVRTDASL